jgi:DNA polymerase-4
MIISIYVPNFWIAVEEQRCPDMRTRPVIIGDNFLTKTAGHARVLMSNDLATEFGVRPGISLAHARQLCPEAVMLSPELSLYAGVWDEVLVLLLTYTPLVESLAPGEAICDVSRCERLFGDPVTIASDISAQITASLALPCATGVASNRLVAQLAHRRGPVGFIPPGQERSFLADFPITALPELDPKTLLAFQVLGIKTVEHLQWIPEKAMAARFGPVGARLARYARGKDDRLVRPMAQAPAITVGRYADADSFAGLDLDALIPALIERLACDLSETLKARRRAGRLLRLVIRAPRAGTHARSIRGRPLPRTKPALTLVAGGDSPPIEIEAAPPDEPFFPYQDSRIHSMLPQPKQPGRSRYLDPGPDVTKPAHVGDNIRPEDTDIVLNPDIPPVAGITIKAIARIATNRPVNDVRTISELTHRLLSRVIKHLQEPRGGHPQDWLTEPGVELLLEMSQFVPPEQITLPGLDDRPDDRRLTALHRQEHVLAARFGTTPFRHVEALNLDSVLSEKIFRWGSGLSRAG